jgi:hypothetical protein
MRRKKRTIRPVANSRKDEGQVTQKIVVNHDAKLKK